MNAPLWEQQELNKAHKRQERDTEIPAFVCQSLCWDKVILSMGKNPVACSSAHSCRRIELYKVNYRGLKTVETLDPFEAQLVPACVQQTTDPNCVARTVDPGELREIKTRNPYTNQVDAIRFVGHWNDASESQDSFVKDQGYGHGPGRRVRI